MKRKLIIVLVLLIAGAVAARIFFLNPRLVRAAGEGNLTDVKSLLKCGAGINGRGPHGRTALHEAAKGGKDDVAEFLIARGAEVNARDDEGKTPLHMAAWQAPLSTAELLVGKGADVNAKDYGYSTPLHGAVRGERTDVIKFLIAKGANLNVKNDLGWTPLDGAKNKGIRTLLASAGAETGKLRPSPRKGSRKVANVVGPPTDTGPATHTDHDTPTVDGDGSHSSLHVAARRGQTEEVSRLIAGGADVKARSANQSTPLHLAACGGHAATARLLLKAGADVNAKDEGGLTPLHWAAMNGYPEVVQVLLAAGADTNAQDADRRTALDWAKSYNREPVIPLLQKEGGRQGEGAVPAGAAGPDRKSVRVILKTGAEFQGALISEDDKEIVLNVQGADIAFPKANVKRIIR